MDPRQRHIPVERRQYVRYSCRTELKTIIDFNPGVARRIKQKVPSIEFRKGETGAVRDISEKGISIELGHLLPEGMIIKIAIDNPVSPPIETVARVVWSKKLSGKKKRYLIGMAFRHMKEKHRKNLKELFQFLQNIPE